MAYTFYNNKRRTWHSNESPEFLCLIPNLVEKYFPYER